MVKRVSKSPRRIRRSKSPRRIKRSSKSPRRSKRRSKSPRRSKHVSKSPKRVSKSPKFISKLTAVASDLKKKLKPKSKSNQLKQSPKSNQLKQSPKQLPYLNEDVVGQIMSYLPQKDIIKSSTVSKTWNTAVGYNNKPINVSYTQMKSGSFEKWFKSHPSAKFNITIDKTDTNVFEFLYNFKSNIYGLAWVQNINKLTEDIGKFSNLQTLYLTKNQLTHLPSSIGNLKNLQYLFLGDNKLKQLPETIGELKNLQILELVDNELTQLPECVGKLDNCKNYNSVITD